MKMLKCVVWQDAAAAGCGLAAACLACRQLCIPWLSHLLVFFPSSTGNGWSLVDAEDDDAEAEDDDAEDEHYVA